MHLSNNPACVLFVVVYVVMTPCCLVAQFLPYYTIVGPGRSDDGCRWERKPRILNFNFLGIQSSSFGVVIGLGAEFGVVIGLGAEFGVVIGLGAEFGVVTGLGAEFGVVIGLGLNLVS